MRRTLWRRRSPSPGGASPESRVARRHDCGFTASVVAFWPISGGARPRGSLFDRLVRYAPAQLTTAIEGSEPAGPAIEALGHRRGDYQELLRLVAWEGLRHAEIAAVLGITPNAVAIRLHRARHRFEAQFHLVTQRDELKGPRPGRTSLGVKGSMAGDQVRERTR